METDENNRTIHGVAEGVESTWVHISAAELCAEGVTGGAIRQRADACIWGEGSSRVATGRVLGDEVAQNQSQGYGIQGV